MMGNDKYIDQTDLFYCPQCNQKELVFFSWESKPKCQVCGEFVEPEPDLDHYDWYFESLEGDNDG